MAQADTRMRDDALEYQAGRRKGKTEQGVEYMTPATHTMPNGAVMEHAVHGGPSVGSQMAKGYIMNRLLKMWPAYYKSKDLEAFSLEQLTALLDVTPNRPAGPAPPALSFLTYE